MPEPTALIKHLAVLTGWQRSLIGLLAGGVMTLGHAPVYLPWGFFLAVPMVFCFAMSAPSTRAAAFVGWCVGFGYFVTGLHWVGHAFLVDPERHAWMMPFAVTLLPAFLAFFWAGAFALSHRLRRSGLLASVLIFAGCLTAVEFLRGHILTGFPWALPAYVWVETPVLQSASLIGPYGLTWLMLVLTALPLVAVAERRAALSVSALAIFAAIWVWGIARVPAGIETRPDGPLVRVVQPNAPQHQKWKREFEDLFYQRLLTLTAEPGMDGRRPDVIIWPETAVTFLPARDPARVAEIADAAKGATVVLGALHAEDRPEGGYDLTNSIVTVLPGGSLGPRYDKHH
ncbi:MAG: apolipoprotein N-acyltransferase, partial [Pseudomonadota bacterium]